LTGGCERGGVDRVSAPLAFARLTDVPLDSVLELLNERRNRRHMPLAGPGDFDADSARKWVAAKDAQWESHGFGPWAVLHDGDFAGWAGFQREEGGADFALVLLPRYWGLGLEVTAAALERGFDELGLDEVLIALPRTRRPDRVVARWGFTPAGDVVHGDVVFRQYRLTRAAWAQTRLSP
jgi:ribosomal-protein-alanine N-acetyltransferase